MEISTGIQFVIGLGVLVAGTGYAWGQFKKGSLEGKKSTIDLLSEEVEKLRDLLNTREEERKEEQQRHDKTIHELEKQIVQLRTQIDEKDKKILEYIQIFQGRNPQLENVLNRIATSLDDIHKFMEKHQAAIQ